VSSTEASVILMLFFIIGFLLGKLGAKSLPRVGSDSDSVHKVTPTEKVQFDVGSSLYSGRTIYTETRSTDNEESCYADDGDTRKYPPMPREQGGDYELRATDQRANRDAIRNYRFEYGSDYFENLKNKSDVIKGILNPLDLRSSTNK